jgi:hypothetical protein
VAGSYTGQFLAEILADRLEAESAGGRPAGKRADGPARKVRQPVAAAPSAKKTSAAKATAAKPATGAGRHSAARKTATRGAER